MAVSKWVRWRLYPNQPRCRDNVSSQNSRGHDAFCCGLSRSFPYIPLARFFLSQVSPLSLIQSFSCPSKNGHNACLHRYNSPSSCGPLHCPTFPSTSSKLINTTLDSASCLYDAVVLVANGFWPNPVNFSTSWGAMS